MPDLILIFFLTFTTAILFSRLGVITNNKDIAFGGKFQWNKYYFLSFLIITIFLGTREGVGRDYYSYASGYSIGYQTFAFGESGELGSIWLNNLLYFLGLDYHSFFFVTSLVTIFLLFNSFRNNFQLLPIGIFIFFIANLFPFVINGVRQGIAIMSLFNAIRFINTNDRQKMISWNLFWYLFYIALGALFHYSILFFIPLYFIFNNKVLSLFNSWTLILIVLSGFLISSPLFLTKYIDNIIEMVPKYKDYAALEKYTIYIGSFRMGAFLILFVNILPLLFYNRIKKLFPQSRLYFILFSFGIGFLYAFSKYMMINRVLIYFSSCEIFIYSFLFLYINKYNQKNIYIRLIPLVLSSYFIVKFIYVLPSFMEIQVLTNNYSLWFISLIK